MPTPLDRLLQSPAKAALLAFAGIITAVSAYAIFSDTPVFPANLRDGGEDGGRFLGPVGDPDTWTLLEVRRWLEVVSSLFSGVYKGREME